MTCHCPRYMCYYRPDCRRQQRRSARSTAKTRAIAEIRAIAETQAIVETRPTTGPVRLRLDYLHERRADITAAIEAETNPRKRALWVHALMLVLEAIKRLEK